MRGSPVAVVLLLLGAILFVGFAPARADGPTCVKFDPKTGECLINVPGPGRPGGPGPGGPNPGGPGPGSPKGGPCIDDDILRPPGEVVPCTTQGVYSPIAYWSNARQCYVGRMEPQPPAGDPAYEGHTDGAVYYCQPPGPIVSTGIQIFWSATPPVAALPPDPTQLARQALASMALKAIQIGIVPDPKPGSIGLVGLPVWMWTTPTQQTYGPITRSASAGGITVTATAKVKTLVWSMGDGSTVTCVSPGTPYTDGYGKSDSPTCGHRYSRTSLGQSGAAYQVGATSYWEVAWNGGGENGVINIAFTANTQVRIGELQVLVTN